MDCRGRAYQGHAKTQTEAAVFNGSFPLIAVEEAAHALGKEIANLANILNPQMIVFGGGTISAFPDIVRIVEEDLRKYSLDIISADISVEISQLGTEGAVIGAALLAINDLIR